MSGFRFWDLTLRALGFSTAGNDLVSLEPLKLLGAGLFSSLEQSKDAPTRMARTYRRSFLLADPMAPLTIFGQKAIP